MADQRAARQQAKAPKQSAPTSKKRKAVDERPEERKRTRTEEQAGVPAGFFDDGAAQEAEATAPDVVAAPAAPIEDAIQQPDVAEPILPVADAELDAFMAEMDQAAAEQPQRNPISYTGAIIESAPMTAAQLAAQAREEQSAQRARRDEEMEDEKDEAARALEDEFEEMDGLEERVKKLREQREALRAKRTATEAHDDNPPLPTPQADDEDSESEDEDWDDWQFGPA
ncbi:uncharacterized protein N0V89_009126 [Didymosphaeria variabile]|uniref:Uncharacterized protein n=1 Tax=Didymosphaeria variabile TaxID=1932322 RepID=A0A9W8XH87_9PLEO|nr:uncharacterized protein N0V89_009126 [Didymosphaeria variabile]KAJ4350505.1 hypothetical protein N0V89_009126 [Didymosphaeria variabile]